MFIFHYKISGKIIIRIIGLFSFSDNIMAAFNGYNTLPFVSHLWTIAFEEQFYIFIPIIILLLVRSSRRIKIIVLIASVLLLNLVRFLFIKNNISYPAIYVLPITHFDSILMGIIIGFGGLNFILNKINPIIIFIIGVFCFFLQNKFPILNNISYWQIASFTFIGIYVSLILFSILNSNFLKKIFSLKILVFLGKRSYGLYLYHILGIYISDVFIRQTNIHSNYIFCFIFSLFFTIAISIISYKFIETPFLKIKKRFELISSRPI